MRNSMVGYSLSPEAEAARADSHQLHLQIVAEQVRRLPPTQLPRALLQYERQRLPEHADIVRQEWARRAPGTADVLAQEAAAYERRRLIDHADGHDPLCSHAALRADLAGRDDEGVAHEAAMYERLGWERCVRGCRRELGRRKYARKDAENED